MNWKAIARSAIGTSHQKQEMPCQDYGSYKIIDDVIIGAVADGAGSAKYAEIGAKLAVETVLEAFTAEDISKITASVHSESSETKNQSNSSVKSWNFLGITNRNGSSSVAIHQPLSYSEQEVRQIFTKTVQKVRVTLKEQAKNNNYSVEDLACTLLAFIATPDWIAAIQIGDGFIVLRCQEEDAQLLFPPDKGEYVNETTFVTSANALEAMRVCVKQDKPEFICASTDGLERLAIRMSDWTPFTPFFQPLEQYLQETSNPEQEDEYLKSFLNSDRLNARTDDDKILLLCFYDSSTHSRQ